MIRLYSLGHLDWVCSLFRKFPDGTYFKETRPRFFCSALVKAVIPLLLMELLCSLAEEREKLKVKS